MIQSEADGQIAKRNVELKCACADPMAVKRRATALGARDMGILHQRDTFFRAPAARLKLREFGDGRAELISYVRPDVAKARESDYFIAAVDNVRELSAVLEQALGTGGVVTKKRHLLLYANTRIHLDEVEGLGSFVELETVLAGQGDAEGLAELERVATALGLDPAATIALPYVELLRRG